MAQIETAVVIRRPRRDVFDFLLDLEHATGIDPGIVSVAKRSEGPTTAGTEFEVRQRVPPFGRITKGTSRFTTVDAPSTIAIQAELGPIRPTGRFEFKDVSDGTLVTVAINPNARGVYRILSPLIARRARRLWEARLQRMKMILEG